MSTENFEMTTLRAFLAEWRKGCTIAQERSNYGRAKTMAPSDCTECTDAFLDAVVRLVSPEDEKLAGCRLLSALLRQCSAEGLSLLESLELIDVFLNRKRLAN